MASAYPIAVLMIIALAGAVVLPPLYWLLAFWQRKLGLQKLFKFSLALSTLPVFSLLFLFFGKEISAKYSVLLFFTAPVFCIFALIVIIVITSVKAYRLRV